VEYWDAKFNMAFTQRADAAGYLSQVDRDLWRKAVIITFSMHVDAITTIGDESAISQSTCCPGSCVDREVQPLCANLHSVLVAAPWTDSPHVAPKRDERPPLPHWY
jgi:hypothetical protein